MSRDIQVYEVGLITDVLFIMLFLELTAYNTNSTNLELNYA